VPTQLQQDTCWWRCLADGKACKVSN